MKNIIKRKEIIYIIVALAVGVLLGVFIFGSPSGNNKNSNREPAVEQSKEIIWTCSMHPQIRQNSPGNCPICGMELIPLDDHDAEEESSPDEIQMSPSAIKLAEVQTYTVEKGIPDNSIHLLGIVKPDERKISELTARFGGRIEKLFVNYTGQKVSKGKKLASIYSPDLITAQRELIEAQKYKESNPSLYRATRTKLKLWDLTDKQIDNIEKKGKPVSYFDILSPISGTVTRRDVAIGDYVKEGDPLFEVIDLSKLWIMLDAYESDLPWIKIGDKVDFTLQSLPGKTYNGKVTYINPFIDAKTRVAKVRVEVENRSGKFKPEMFVSGVLRSGVAESGKVLLIPKTSVLWTGKRAVVFVKVPNRKNTSFLYREIELGPESGQFYVVASGLSAGEEIASNGVFQIDAAAQLAGKPSMMNPAGGKVNTMPGMDMGGDKSDAGDEMETDDDETSMSKADATDVPMDFQMQLGKVLDAYLLMKDAFVLGDEKSIVAKAKTTLEALGKVDMTLLKGDAHIKWMKLEKPIKDNLSGIINMKGVEMKRSHFSIVSDKLTEAIEAFGIHQTSVVYLEFCPMAFDNKGAFWLSTEKEIKNPYFGDKMLTCGEVKKTF